MMMKKKTNKKKTNKEKKKKKKKKKTKKKKLNFEIHDNISRLQSNLMNNCLKMY